MLCQARKSDGSYCNNAARYGSKTCHINKHIEQFKRNVQKGGWGLGNNLMEEKKYAVQNGGGWGESKVSWFGGFFN